MGFGKIVGAITGGLLGGSYFGNKAASSQRAAAADANNQLRASQRAALEQLSPYSNYGQQALIPLSALLYGKQYDPEKGEFTGNISDSERFNYFTESPGYQYQLEQGLKAIERRNAATGTLLGGNTLKELQEYGTNLANQDYSNYIDSLMSQANIGQQAATNAANVYTNFGSQLAGYSYAGGMANAQKYSNLSNAMYGMAGMGTSMLGTGGGTSSGGGTGAGGGTFSPAGQGQYNNSFFSQPPSSSYSLNSRY